MTRRSYTTTSVVVLFALVFATAMTTLSTRALGEEEVIEEVDDVQVVAQDTAATTTADTGFTLMQIIGRNHPALVHFPIGLLIAVCLIELISLIRPKWEMGKSGLVLSVFTLLSFIAAGTSGLIRASEVMASRAPSPILSEHRNLMITAAVIFLSSLVLRIAKKDQLDGWVRYLYLGLLVVALLVTTVGGHHGGKLVYGENYLPY